MRISFIFVSLDTKLLAVWELNSSTTYHKPPIMTFTLKKATCCILSTRTRSQTGTRRKACTLVCRTCLKTFAPFKVLRAFKSGPAMQSYNPSPFQNISFIVIDARSLADALHTASCHVQRWAGGYCFLRALFFLERFMKLSVLMFGNMVFFLRAASLLKVSSRRRVQMKMRSCW